MVSSADNAITSRGDHHFCGLECSVVGGRESADLFNEQGESTQVRLFPSDAEVPDDPQVARVLVKKVRVERTRKFGDCYLGLELWKRLQLDDFLAQHMDGDHADVPWSWVAAVLAINRLCHPGRDWQLSNTGIPRRPWKSCCISRKTRSTTCGCIAGWIACCRKTKIEQHLKQRYGELFQAQFDVLLYDLTSMYVEGEALDNPMMRRGYSRDHRPDCEQLVLALIVNCEGFPFNYEVFDGNRADSVLGRVNEARNH